MMNSPLKSAAILPPSIQLIRWCGYGLLILSLNDLVSILLPLGITNPGWEFQTLGAIIDRIPVPLLAMAMIFFGETQCRNRWEFKLISALSWMSLVTGMVLLLLIPMGINSVGRLQQQVVEQMNATYSQQSTQLQQVEQRLNQSSNQEFAELLKRNGIAYDSSQEPREQFLTQLVQYRQQMKTQLDTQRQAQSTALLKNATKWNLGALVSGLLFIYFWRLTGWARKSHTARQYATRA